MQLGKEALVIVKPETLWLGIARVFKLFFGKWKTFTTPVGHEIPETTSRKRLVQMAKEILDLGAKGGVAAEAFGERLGIYVSPAYGGAGYWPPETGAGRGATRDLLRRTWRNVRPAITPSHVACDFLVVVNRIGSETPFVFFYGVPS